MKNKLYVVGIGPGKEEQMTIVAKRVIEECDLVVGYTVYTDIIKEIFPQKETYDTPMKSEVKRVKFAIEQAKSGKKIVLVCSGDAGVYGLCSLTYELLENEDEIEICVVAGISAAFSGGALLGAPLSHDFCVISLSDLLTPWELIEKRLNMAAKGDFTICIYNPSSKKRADYLKRACEILLKEKSPKTICGFTKNIAREGESIDICTLEELKEKQVDMFTTVFVGNSQTRVIKGKMITPRGYKNE